MGDVPAPGAQDTILRRYTQSYIYDAAGNITETKHQLGTDGTVEWKRGYVYDDDNNQLARTSIPGDDYADPDNYSMEYAHDDRGSMVHMPHLKTGAADNLVRDFRDMLRRAYLDESGNESWYAYDAGGQRTRKLWDKGAITDERIYLGRYEIWRRHDTSGLFAERQTLHILDDSQRIAMVETKTWSGGSEVTTPTSRQRYQLGDHLGTACLEVNDLAQIISYEEFHPYGTTAWWAEKSGIQVSRKRYRYTGKEKDEESGLYYHGARYYMPWLGRWGRVDPIGLDDGLNRYSYVRSHPVCYSDPSGTRRDTDMTGRAENPPSSAGTPNEVMVVTEKLTFWQRAKNAARAVGEWIQKPAAFVKGVGIGLAIGAGISTVGYALAAVPIVGGGLALLWGLGWLYMGGKSVVENWDEIKATAGRLKRGEGTVEDWEFAGTVVGGLLSGGLKRPAKHVGAEATAGFLSIFKKIPKVQPQPALVGGGAGGGAMSVAADAVIVGEAAGEAGAVAGATGGTAGFVSQMAGESPNRTKKKGLSPKDAASDVPSWAKGEAPRVGENGKAFAKRLLEQKYGPGNWRKGPGSEFNKIRKWGDRAFE